MVVHNRWLRTKFVTTCLMTAIGASVLSGSAHSAEVQIVDETHELMGLIPDFLLDHSGFQLEEESRLSLAGIDQALDPIPLFPLYEKGSFSNQFLGVKVPAEFFSGRPEVRAENPNFQIISTNPMNPKQAAIAQEIRKIQLEDGVKLVPYFYNGSLYGIRSDVRVEFSRSKTVGFGLTFGEGRTINLGSNLTIGGSLNFGGTRSYVQKATGINLLSGFQKLLELPAEFNRSGDHMEFYRQTIKFAPYIRHYLNKNAEGLRVPHGEYRANRLGSVRISAEPKPVSLQVPVDVKNLSSEFQDIMSDLRLPENLSQEVKWRQEVRGAAENQLVLVSENANKFLQKLCDHLSAAFEVPAEVQPRCRIAASLAPNAWAYPGGDIFVSVGLIGVLSDLDSLRLVLGHEIAHVVARHTTRAMPGRKAFMYAATAASIAAQVGLGPYALSGGNGVLGDVNWLTWFPQSMALSMGGAIVTKVGMEVLFMGPFAALMAHQRSLEWQADRLGHEVALVTGARPEKLGQGWAEFRDFIQTYLDPDGKKAGSLFASHPAPEDRLASIQAKGPKLFEKLSLYQPNRLPESYYRDYSELHEQFRPNTLAWGENALSKLRKGESHAAQFSIWSLMSPAGRCVVHALSGAGLVNH